ncbi:MAG: OsmC family peroxiredoxin [Anaerolineaceae bacterium]|nr:MAG: OsmC family peroxiredoxin [Anaerolineaceae bacterium]
MWMRYTAGMANNIVHLNWNPETQFVLRDNENYQIVMKPKGVKASDLLTMGLIGCSSHDVVEILQKQRQDLRELRVTADSVQDDDPPWRFRKIHIRFQAVGKGLDVEKVCKAIKLSEEKYCSVYVTLREAVEITNEVEVVEMK